MPLAACKLIIFQFDSGRVLVSPQANHLPVARHPSKSLERGQRKSVPQIQGRRNYQITLTRASI